MDALKYESVITIDLAHIKLIIMKLKIIMLSISLAAICQTLTAQPNFEWAKNFGGSGFEQGNGIAVDNSGNVYTIGYFAGTADFDPGPGIYSLTANGSADIFISKLDSMGNLVWARAFGSTDWDKGNSIALDNSGNIYATGFFSDTVDFDPGPGVFNLTSVGITDIFICKLDASGNYLWAKSVGGTDYDFGISIKTDDSGNVYTTGNFLDTVDFDPCAATYSITSMGTYDIFILKLDSSGNYIWVKTFGGQEPQSVSSIDVDASGNVYTTGYFYTSADFDPGPNVFYLISEGENDVFVSKLDSMGNFIWAKQFGNYDEDEGLSIATDNSGNVYTTGTFKVTVDFDPGQGGYNLISAGSEDIFISKLDSTGSFIWAKSFGNISVEKGLDITLDNSGNVYAVGQFTGTVDFDPGPGVFNLNSNGDYDLFICKLTSSGNLVWAKSMGALGVDLGGSIAVDDLNNVYTTGYFQSTVDFDPGPGVHNLTASGMGDVFILKLSNSTTGISENNLRHSITLFPNPTEGKITISTNSTSGIDAVIIRDILGKEVFVKNFSSAMQIEFTLEGASGLYFVELICGDNKSYSKVIKE
ncbi:MAG: hypothetical protein FNNCIFGK_02234 [Bacteroidia bacterium]|nr:hypothetical protein [Bacteroidia bacterium]MCE7955713.1 T9SS C-terminal target domain-containing protein [Bacteroidetes bacterium CHB6]